MFKILIALSLFLVAIQGQLIGGYHERPDLVNSPTTRTMVKLAVTELAKTQNLEVSPIDVFSVATQVVNGINFRIVFSAHNAGADNALFCTTTVYQRFTGQQSVTSVNCA